MTIATADKFGFCDVSPRGDYAGCCASLNEKQLVIPEKTRNTRIDSMQNILTNPRVGILFFIPGLDETLRVNGKGYLVKIITCLRNDF